MGHQCRASAADNAVRLVENCGTCGEAGQSIPSLVPAVHEIATGMGRACRRKHRGGRSSASNKQPGGDPMQSKAQIDQMLRQKSDAVEIPGVVAVAASGSEV